MSERYLICHLSQLADPDSRGFSIDIGDATIEGFVIQKDGQQYAYRNSCPHTGSPLDWVEHQFLDLDKAFIQCAVHDARFEMENGHCVSGPCAGESLQKLAIETRNEAIYLVDFSTE
jgi:nitrite reductase/ring-hydroxylating ferredoxin subunit